MIICSKIFHGIEGDGDRHLVQMVLDDNGETLGQLGDPVVAKRAELRLHDKIETMVAERGVSGLDAFRAVLADPSNAGLRQAYAGFTQDRHGQQGAEPEMSWFEASTEIDTRARTYMAEHDKADYHAAVRIVLAADPELEVAYAQC